MMKSIYSGSLALVFLLQVIPLFAQVNSWGVEGDVVVVEESEKKAVLIVWGEATGGENMSLNDIETDALTAVKRRAIEWAGTAVVHVGTVDMGALTESILKTGGKGAVRILEKIDKKVEFSAEYNALQVKLKAKVEVKIPDLQKMVDELKREIEIGRKKRRAHLDVEEMLFGETLRTPRMKPHLKNALTKEGWVLVEKENEADIIVNLKVASRKGASMKGLYSAYVDVIISVVDRKVGGEIYGDGIHDIKGVKFDYPDAGLKAYEAAVDSLVKTLVPDLLKQVKP